VRQGQRLLFNALDSIYGQTHKSYADAQAEQDEDPEHDDDDDDDECYVPCLILVLRAHLCFPFIASFLICTYRTALPLIPD
jgi:hypothetical protein